LVPAGGRAVIARLRVIARAPPYSPASGAENSIILSSAATLVLPAALLLGALFLAVLRPLADSNECAGKRARAVGLCEGEASFAEAAE
jgi:hypothetical protein